MTTVLVATERDLEFNVLSQQLAGQGYALVRSKDGVDALEAIRTHQPDVLLANVLLPKLDGFALYRRCQQDDQLRHVPMVLFSTRSNDQKSERFAADMGVAHFVGNALKSSQLGEVINAARQVRPEPLPDRALAPRATQQEPAQPVVNGHRNGANGVVHPDLDRTIAHAFAPQSAVPEPVLTPAPKQEITPPAAASDRTTHTIGMNADERAEAERRSWLEEQARQKEALRLAQTQAEQWREQGELFNLSPAAMWIVAKTTQRMLNVNDAALKLFGYDRDEFLRLSADALLKAPAAQLSTQIKTFQTKDGRALSLLLSARDLTHAGQPAEVFSANDVSVRVRGERAIADELRRMRVVLAAVSLPYVLVNGANRVLDANEAFMRLVSQRRDALLETDLAALLAEPVDVNDVVQAGRTITLSFKSATQTHRVEATVGRVDMAGDVRMLLCRPLPDVVQDADKPAAAPRKLPAVLEMLRFAEDADETTLLQYAMAQLAKAFSSPLALFAGLERITQTLEVLAIKQLEGNHGAELGAKINMPAPWSGLLAQCDSKLDMAADESMLVNSLPEISSYAACSVAGSTRDTKPAWLLVLANRDQAYSEQEQQELRECAEFLAALVARKRIQFKIQAAHQRQAASMDGMVSLVERLIDVHDVYAAGSGRRVAALAINMARRLELSDERTQALAWAARLHDLGHLMIPRDLLLMPRTLTSDERALVKSHIEQGARLLRSVDFGADIASIVYQHHERMDGSGYPLSTKGEFIGIEARILGVADVVDAMMTARAHRRAQDLSAALAELEAGSGSRYDSAVVAACKQVFEQSGGQWPVV